jgi:hypothetical protein
MIPILEQSDTATSVRYMTHDIVQVQRFLSQHPQVQQLLLEAMEPLQHAFGKDVAVAVTVMRNADLDDREFLVSSIQTPRSAVQAHACLDAFDETWWLDNAQRANGQLIFTVAFP